MNKTILLNKTENAGQFAAIASRAAEPVQVHSGRYIVDGKSILGLLSLDLTHLVTVEYDERDAEALYDLRLFETPANLETYLGSPTE